MSSVRSMVEFDDDFEDVIDTVLQEQWLQLQRQSGGGGDYAESSAAAALRGGGRLQMNRGGGEERSEWRADGLLGLGSETLRQSIAEIIQDDISCPIPISTSRQLCIAETSESQFTQGQRDMLHSPANTYASLPGSIAPDSQRNAGPMDLVAGLSGLRLSLTEGHPQNPQMSLEIDSHRNSYSQHRTALSSGTYCGGSSPSYLPNVNSPNSVFSGYGMNPPSPTGVDYEALNLGTNSLAATVELQNLSRLRNQSSRSSLQTHLIDPSFLQSMSSNEAYFLDLQKAFFYGLLAAQGSQHGSTSSSQASCLGHNYCGGSMQCHHIPYTGEVLLNSPYVPTSPLRCSEKRPAGGAVARWHPGPFSNIPSSLLELIKLDKTREYTLSEIKGQVLHFSSDQFGSRFIQEKLETATVEEKDMVFREIIPQALTLMTDVFGNYVIQKFLEFGSPRQVRELVDKMMGNVLTLSLQMYGCRVIQKAMEIVEVDRRTAMVSELDGHVMRCVRDQNGNHVIQKCIGCVPEDAIQFMINTFFGQVVTLSSHPYGCRVIQRVLEHCHSPVTQQKVMSEILESVCLLAQNQYGNYVVQHVLELGKPEERSFIINKLKGKIVQMSQQKFSSNVIEKCLVFGTTEERQAVVDEMLSSTDENDPLQVLMKDQFANYVVQKVLETCDDQQLEVILDRIKVHLNVLKKYTYGKHIVARVEKLVVAGERRRIENLASQIE